MKVKTSRFGELNVVKDQIFRFPEPIAGFETDRRYIIFQTDETSEIYWLQSLDNPEVAFIVTKVDKMVKGYNVPLNKEHVATLKIKEPSDAEIFVMLVVDRENNKVTANLLGPIVLNVKARRGMQIIMQNSDYSIRHNVDRSGKASKKKDEYACS